MIHSQSKLNRHWRYLLALCILIVPTLADADRPVGLDSDFLFITTTEYNYSGGNYDLMDARPPYTMHTNQGVISTDNKLYYYDGLIYVVNGYGYNNIQIIDPIDFSTIRQFSTGAGSNPVDICFVSPERAFVARYGSTDLWEINPATGTHTDTIDLSVFADADGIPEMYAMAIHNNLLYVTIQRLDRNNWDPADDSYLAVVDLADNTLRDMNPEEPGVQGILLASTNPNCAIVIDPDTGDFLIAEMGFYGALDGCIERFSPHTQQSLGMIITEVDLGGDIKNWITSADGQAFAITLSPSWTTSLTAFDRVTGEIRGTVLSSNEGAYSHLAIDDLRRELYIADRTYSNPGLRIYNIDLLIALTDDPILTGLYPHQILAIPGPAADVNQDSFPLAANSQIAAWPQPATGRVNFQLSDITTDYTSVDILDLSGRHIVRLMADQKSGPEQVITWNGRDRFGRRVPSGIYLITFRSAGATHGRKIHITN